MEITVFFAQLWGPITLAIGLGIFISRPYYIKTYRDLQNETLAVLIFGMMGIAAGIIQVTAHNEWSTLPQVVISILGWGLLIKGAVFMIAPGLVDKWGDWAADSKLIPVAGVTMLVIGAYLSWFAYFA